MNYYNYDRVISYNIPVNCLFGERGVGKSFGAKKYVIKDYIKKKHKFLYLRRYEKELNSVFDPEHPFFNSSIKEIFPEHKLYTKGKKFYCDDECFGIAKRLTEAQDLKSGEYEDIKTIIIDEYPIEKNRRYYLPDEGMILMSIFDSIARNRNDIRIFILGNAVEGLEYSPLFTFFDLSLPYNNDIKLFHDNTILVQYMQNLEFRKERENTLIGKLAKGTKYFDYAINNKILDKNNNFIEKKQGSAKFSFAFIYNNETYGVWNDYHLGKVYVSKDYNKFSYAIFTLTLKDHQPNTMMINSLHKYNFWKTFIENFKLGNVYFENQKIKHNTYEAIKLYIR